MKLGCRKWFGCPLVLRNTRSWRFQLSCKQSKCPGTAKTFQSPTQPMQRDHRERLWDYRKRERCLTSFQVFQLPAVPALVSWLQLHGRPWARSTQARPFQFLCHRDCEEGNKMIIVVLRHSVWGEICCIARDNLNTSIPRNLTISPTFRRIAWFVLCNTFSAISVTKHTGCIYFWV